ncbi:MAG: hypothetical protein KDA21_02760, partial [Phycisphaerales bacterium]|nr:hypothetical protein [Phycisphaerales bacterium]
MKMRSLVVPATLAGLCGSATAAAVPTVIFSHHNTGDASAVIPGVENGDPGNPNYPVAYFQQFERPSVSPDGSQWVVTGFSNLTYGGLTTDFDEFLITGAGPGRTGAAVLAAEGTDLNGAMPPGHAAGFFDTRIGINNAGQYALVTNSPGDFASDEFLMTYDGSAFSVFAQEGMAIPGIAGENYGGDFKSVGITGNGTPYFNARSTEGGLDASQDDFLFHGNTIIAQTGVTVPAGQAGGATAAWENFDVDRFYMSDDGLHHLIQGDLVGFTADDVVVIDGMVVAQEDTTVIDGVLVDDITEAAMMPNGDWFMRGHDNFNDWIMFNGAVVAKEGEAVPGGLAGEVYAGPFSSMSSDSQGNFVFIGDTNAALSEDGVLIYNGTEILLREGDYVDLDGDGLL